MNPQELVYPYGDPRTNGLLKACPQDFVVAEELAFEPSGEGEHLWLQVEKTGLTTVQLVQRIARDFSLQPGQIGFSGMKDKNAQTTQWLSLHLPGRYSPKIPGHGDGYRVLQSSRHQNKLRRGTHKFNRFAIRLRQVKDLPDESRAQLASLQDTGMANYFGPQRFGRAGDNVAQALAQLAVGRLKRARRGMLLSALRSHLFNRILSRRIELGHWLEPLEGDVFMLRGSRSIFSQALDRDLNDRFESMDIASTASLYGSGSSRLSGIALDIENQVLDRCRDMTACLDRFDIKRQMRPLRVATEGFEYEWLPASNTLCLELRLPAGSYLTSLLAHFIDVTEPDQSDF